MRRLGWVVGIVIGVFFVIRAIVELFTIDFSDPASYQDDWGGPSLFGVLLVHVSPGFVAVAVFVVAYLSRRSVPGRREG